MMKYIKIKLIIRIIIIQIFSLTLAGNAPSRSNSYSPCAFLVGCEFYFVRFPSRFSTSTNTDLKCNHRPTKTNLASISPDNRHTCGLKSKSMSIIINNVKLLDSSMSSTLGILAYSEAYTVRLILKRVSRINVESPAEIPQNWTNILTIRFFDSSLSYVDQKGGRVESCEQFDRLNSSVQHFIKSNSTMDIDFLNTRYNNRPVCESLLKNMKIRTILFGIVYETFFKTNLPRFLTSNKSDPINTDITSLEMFAYEIDLDTRTLNKQIFLQLAQTRLLGRFRSIQTDLFVYFRSLRNIEMLYSNFEGLSRRQGIEWIREINRDLDVDLSNETSVQEQRRRFSVIFFELKEDLVLKLSYFDNLFPDSDFCLYRAFPFKQLVFLDMVPGVFTHNFTCTFLWLHRFHHQLSRFNWFLVVEKFQPNESLRCNFTQQFDLCDKKSFMRNKNVVQALGFLVFSEFLVIVASPIVCLLGIVSNSLVVSVLVNKKFEKEFKQKHYEYMVVYSVCNIVICICEILTLINECQKPFGLFCSSIRKYFPIQYSKLIFGEFFSHFFISMSNFTYMLFSLCRLSLIGTENNKLVRFFAKTSTKKILFVLAVLSTGLAVIKPLQYKIDFSDPLKKLELLDDYPNLFYKHVNLSMMKNVKIFRLKIILNIFYDFVNYFVFVFGYLVVDLILLRGVRRVMREKEEKMREQIRALRDKVHKENRKSFRELVRLVVWNSACGLLLKLPNSITSLNDFRLLVFNFNLEFFSRVQFETNYLAFPYTMRNFCLVTKVCLVFHSFGRFLYVTSLSLNFLFIRRFDRNFRQAFETIFGSAKKNKNTQKN